MAEVIKKNKLTHWVDPSKRRHSRTVFKKQYDISDDERAGYKLIKGITQYLTGLDISEQVKISDNNSRSVLSERTKEHRFNLIKKYADRDIQNFLAMSATAHYILSDFIDQLRSELDIRKVKNEAFSE
jgi:hypothetical protein